MNMREKLQQGKVLAVVGLGYVGLPLALAFAKKVQTIGFDINEKKLNCYRHGIDPTGEAGNEAVQQTMLEFTADPAALEQATFIIVAVPTPITEDDMPDLTAVKSASRIVGKHLRPGRLLRIDSLSRRHPPHLCAYPGRSVGPGLWQRFQSCLFTGTHQSRR